MPVRPSPSLFPSLLRSVAVCAFATLGLGACGAAHRRPALDPVVPADQLALEVDNNNWSDVVLWIAHDGRRERFLIVGAARSLVRAIPATMVGSDGTLQFIAHRIGGGDDYYVSPRVSVRTGYTVSLTLEDNLQHSSIGIW